MLQSHTYHLKFSKSQLNLIILFGFKIESFKCTSLFTATLKLYYDKEIIFQNSFIRQCNELK